MLNELLRDERITKNCKGYRYDATALPLFPLGVERKRKPEMSTVYHRMQAEIKNSPGISDFYN